jgi:hypothetical protein
LDKVIGVEAEKLGIKFARDLGTITYPQTAAILKKFR